MTDRRHEAEQYGHRMSYAPSPIGGRWLRWVCTCGLTHECASEAVVTAWTLGHADDVVRSVEDAHDPTDWSVDR